MDNAEVIKELHRALAELIKILQEDEYGIKKFPRFLYIHQQVSLAIENPDALEDFPFLEDIKDMILGMYTGMGEGTFLDYGIWKDDEAERGRVNVRLNHLRDDLIPKLARSLKTR